jgi:hypothetical protein
VVGVIAGKRQDPPASCAPHGGIDALARIYHCPRSRGGSGRSGVDARELGPCSSGNDYVGITDCVPARVWVGTLRERCKGTSCSHRVINGDLRSSRVQPRGEFRPGESLMSSVPGLSAAPNKVIRLPGGNGCLPVIAF